MTQEVKVLLIADSPAAVALLRQRVVAGERCRIAVDDCRTLPEARTRLAAGRYDAVLLDLGSPDSQGMRTLAGILESAPTTPVLVLTGSDDVDTSRLGLLFGAQDDQVRGQAETLIAGALRTTVARAAAQRGITDAYDNLRGMLDASEDAILILGEANEVKQYNRAARALFGARLVEGQAIALPGAHENSADIDLTRADGTPCTVEIRVGQASWHGAPARIVTLRDITERRRVEQALRLSDLALRKAQAVAHVGSWTWDIPQDRLEWSDEMHRIFGIDPEGFSGNLGEVLARSIHPDDKAAVEASNASVLREGVPVPLEYRVVLPDGEVRTVWAEAGELSCDEAGRPLRLSGIVQDITERKRLQAQVAQADRLSSMGTLAAGVAHEINNPLSFVLSNLESLARDLPQVIVQCRLLRSELEGQVAPELLAKLGLDGDHALSEDELEDMGARLREAADGARRIRDTVRGLSSFARIDEEESRPVQLTDAIEAACRMALNQIRYRARLVQELAPVPPVLASDSKLSQVFLNLLINAAHAIPEGQLENNEIRVRTWVESAQVCAEVRDTGGGIAPQHLTRIFDPFFTTKAVGKGSGLGLAISHGIVQSFGGTLEVASTLGKGTSFTLRLPVAVEQPGAPSAPPLSATATADLKGVRVLVIDDEDGVRSALRRVLRDAEVTVAESGEQAQALIEAGGRYDLILCDMMMPGLSGMDVHAWLQEQHPDQARRMVFITGGAFTPAAQAFLSGIDNRCVEKPFDRARLRATISELVASWRPAVAAPRFR
ncbi:MAG: response regulator [Pseudomonadota bacterium]